MNPANDSKYARYRLVKKGHRDNVKLAMDALGADSGMKIFKYHGVPSKVNLDFHRDWGVNLRVTRRPPTGRQVLGTWGFVAIPDKLRSAAGALASDMVLIWDDFLLTAARRIGTAGGAGYDPEALSRYTGKSLLLLAFGRDRFDIILSKWGYGDDLAELKKKHYFFQWQARIKVTADMANVDDFEDGEA